jgi:hypothetical protein
MFTIGFRQYVAKFVSLLTKLVLFVKLLVMLAFVAKLRAC